MAVCQNKDTIVTRNTSFKPLVANWVHLRSVHWLSVKRVESPLISLSQKSTLGQTCTHMHWKTHYNTAPRGLGHPADSILFPLNGSCVTKGQFSLFLARLPAWDPSVFLADLWLQVFLCFYFRNVFFPFCSSPSLPLFFFSSSQVVCRGCPGNLAGCPADSSPTTIINTHPLPLPPPEGWTAELAPVSPAVCHAEGH